MLTIFNRRELLTVLSTEQMFRVKEALAEAEIPFRAVSLNRGGPCGTWGRGMPFIQAEYLYQYRIYVHKNDHDRAMAAIQPALRED